MTKHFFSLFAIFLLLLHSTDASALAPRMPRPPSLPGFDENSIRAMVLQEMKQIEADPNCRVFSMTELFPSFRGDFSRVRQTRAWPPTVLTSSGIPVGFTSDNRHVMPSDYECDKNGGSSCWLEAYAVGVANSGVDLESHAIRGYCHRQNPNRREDVFELGYDVPAEFISLWTRAYIQYKWGGAAGDARLQEQYRENDIVGLYELNLSAADLWQKILTCARGDAESARRFYYEASYSCGEGAALLNEVSTFSQNVRNYYRTSFFRESSPVFTDTRDYVRRMQSRDSIVNLNIGEMPSYHPLFSQMSLEFLLEVLPIDRRVSREDFEQEIATARNGVDSRTFTAIAKHLALLPKSVVNPSGLWPSAARTARGFVEYRSMQIAASLVEGGHAVWLGGIPTYVDHRRLPEFYSNFPGEIAQDFREIGRRYQARRAR